jgi:hypothetical protein
MKHTYCFVHWLQKYSNSTNVSEHGGVTWTSRLQITQFVFSISEDSGLSHNRELQDPISFWDEQLKLLQSSDFSNTIFAGRLLVPPEIIFP